jgi:hypothetical protein
MFESLDRDRSNTSYMSKPNLTLINLKSRSGQILPYTLFGTILFAWVSSAHLNQFFAAYLILLAAQLGTLGIYLLSRQLKARDSTHADSQDRSS